MKVTVGTFNLNNLFSRYNFKAEIEAIRSNQTDVDSGIQYQFENQDRIKIRSYQGRLIKGKKRAETEEIANRILGMDVDVLAVQEVEDIDTLKQFNRDHLNGLYSQVILVEGNDPRLIDVAVLSKLPIGGVTSWQTATHQSDPQKRIFGRDLLEVQILNSTRKRKLFSLFNTHLKSHYVDYRDDPDAAQQANNLRRYRQAETVARIVKAQTRPDSRFMIVGDMNDPPDSAELSPFVDDAELNLSNALTAPLETRPAKDDDPPPASTAWTHRYKKARQPADYQLFDQIWLSPALADMQAGAWIDRRRKHGGDGSDHDPAYVGIDV